MPKQKHKLQKLKNLTYWSLFLFIAFTLFGITIGRIEAYESEYGQYGGQFIGSHIPQKNSNNAQKQTENIDSNGSQEENPLCDLEAVICPNEKQGTIREISAYNSVSAQTDASPCISADGTDICQRYKKGECIVATNAYPLKTKLRIDKIGDCTVADRMASRFTQRIDLFMDKDIQRAINFGVQKLNVVEL